VALQVTSTVFWWGQDCLNDTIETCYYYTTPNIPHSTIYHTNTSEQEDYWVSSQTSNVAAHLINLAWEHKAATVWPVLTTGSWTCHVLACCYRIHVLTLSRLASDIQFQQLPLPLSFDIISNYPVNPASDDRWMTRCVERLVNISNVIAIYAYFPAGHAFKLNNSHTSYTVKGCNLPFNWYITCVKGCNQPYNG